MRSSPLEGERVQLKQAIRGAIVRAGPDRRVISSKGTKQNWLIDMRPVLLNPDLLETICILFWERFRPELPFQIAGMESAAIPLVTGLILKARQLGLSATGLIIRKERKPTGLGNSIEGLVTGEPIVLVDDIFNSGSSVKKALASLKQLEVPIKSAFAIIDYESGKGKATLAEHKLRLSSLFTLKDFGLATSRRRWAPKVAFKLEWHFGPPEAFPYYVVPKSTPLLMNERLYFGSDTGTLWCLNAADGSVAWHFKAPGTARKGIWSTPCFSAGRVFFGAYNGNVYCLDAASGAVVWGHPACEWIGSSPVVVERHGVVIIGLEYERQARQGSMAALSLETGEKIWEEFLNVYQHGSAAYCARTDTIVYGTNDHTLVAADPATGATRWSLPTDRSIKYVPAIDSERGLVATASFDGNIRINDLNTGALLYRVQTDNICYTTPLILGERVFCGSGDRHLYVLDLARQQVELKLDCRARVYASPRRIGDCVGFGCNSGMYRELDAQSLELVGEIQLPDSITNAVASSPEGDRLYVPTYMNEIYCFTRESRV